MRYQHNRFLPINLLGFYSCSRPIPVIPKFLIDAINRIPARAALSSLAVGHYTRVSAIHKRKFMVIVFLQYTRWYELDRLMVMESGMSFK